MSENLDEIARKHRTFEMPGPLVRPGKPLHSFARPVYQSGGRGFSPQTQMGMPATMHSRLRVFAGYRFDDGQLVPVIVREWDGQRFDSYATPWEAAWCTLCRSSNGKMAPIFSDTGEVIGHYGVISGVELARFTDPRAAGGEIAYVVDPDIIQRMHWRDEIDDKFFAVVTALDGEVLAKVHSHTRSLIPVDVSPLDLVEGARLLVQLGAGLGARLLRGLQRRSARKSADKVMAGPTRELAEQSAARKVSLDDLNIGYGYDPRMGIPPEHLPIMVEAAKQTNSVAIFRANKSAAIPLIQRGAVGKPKVLSIPGFKSNSTTGVLTASAPQHFAVAKQNGYFIVEADGVARRTVMRNGQTVTEEMTLNQAYWKVEKGQIIDPTGHPVVGDYDLLGVIPLDSPGRNIVPVPKGGDGDWIGPDVARYQKAVNDLLDKPRVLHGAQDQFHNRQWGGLTDETAYAVFPDGRTLVMVNKAEQEALYAAYGRQTAIGTYNP